MDEPPRPEDATREDLQLTESWSAEGWDIPNPGRLQVALDLLSVACRPGASVVDLGCLHGAYTVEFAKLGYQAAGIEARTENVARCQERAAESGLPNLRFIQDDVRNLAAYGSFDAVFCCGLLYHLDEPVKFLQTLGQVTSRLLILQTHFALYDDDVNEGRKGIWYDESGPGNPWASWGNRRSFWLIKEALLDATQDAGFDLVFELHDHVVDIKGSPSRGMFAAIKV